MTRLRTFTIALALSALLVACSGDDSGTSESFSGDDAGFGEVTESTADVADREAAEEPADDAAVADAEAPSAAPASAAARANRRVIRTAELTLEVEDTATALEEVIATAERVGGFAATSDLQRDIDGVVRGMITLRVPSDELNRVVDELEAIGDAVPVNRIDERDVTTESADLRARIDNLTAYERELTGLLADVRQETSRPEDLLTIFERIRSVREEIDLMEGRLASIDEQVALSTVRVTLRPTERPDTFADTGWAPGETFREALAATGRALATIADAAIWLVVTALPVALTILIVPALLIVLLVRWARQRRRNRPARDRTTPPPPNPSSESPADPGS
ncbi:MAG: DUF4349 domain-containing protein [Intrasporangiaceae bacterium]|nr:DUF4349 domain-containing protein [Intrasporangiaceae bacterium]